MPNQGQPDGLSVSDAGPASAAEWDGDLSECGLRGCDCPCGPAEGGTPLTLWAVVLVVAVLAWWVGLAWAITRWG